jgi:hypothetical protein
MDQGTDQAKTVNKNDNQRSSWLLKISSEAREKAAPFIPLADWLIAKHCQKWWRNHPETWDYQYCQMGICLNLATPRDTREWTLHFIAIYLDCNPINLINDCSDELKNIPTLKFEKPEK